MQRLVVLRRAVAVLFLGALFAAPGVGAGEPEPGDEADLVLGGSYRLRGEIVGRRGPFLEVRVGARTYEFEAGSVSGTAAEAAAPRPLWRALVTDLVPWLVAEDPALARAARAGLEALGPDAAPYLRLCATPPTTEDVAAAATRLADELEARAGDGER